MRGRAPARVAALIAATALVGAALAACGSSPRPVPDGLPAGPDPGSSAAATAYAVPGPFAAGVTEVTTPQGDPVVITYPADKSATRGHPHYSVNLIRWFTDVPAASVPASLAGLGVPTTFPTAAYAGVPISAKGPFPVVLFSHGYGGYPEQSSFLTVRMATWGFVVVAPDHRSRDLAAVVSGTTQNCTCDVTDLRRALDDVTTMDHTPGTLLSGKLDLKRVGVVGHSAGGGAALSVAAVDPRITTYVALAPALGSIPPAGKHGLVMQGTADKVVDPSGTLTLYGQLHSPKELVLVDKAGHNAFDDGCEIGAAQGGLVAFVGKLNLPPAFATIATDGCTRPDVPPPLVWPLVDHATIAELRYGLGIDPQPVGLGPSMDHAYLGVTASVRSS